MSGSLAGLAHGSVNLVLVEPYLDAAIEVENQALFASGQEEDTPEFRAEYEEYRTWQKGGQVLAGVVLGTSFGSLFGIVYAASRHTLPARSEVAKSLVLAGIMWLVIYIIPLLKYPANPPAVGDGDTVALRAMLYVAFVAISGSAAVGFYMLSSRLPGRKKLAALTGYVITVSIAFALMPANPDAAPAASAHLDGFRAMSVVGVSVFWGTVGCMLGMLWRRYKPHDSVEQYR